MNWHTCSVSLRLFFSVVAGEQTKALTTSISTSQDFFWVLRDYSLAPCNFLSMGMLRHYDSSRPFRFAKHFSLFVFVFSVLVVSFQFFYFS
jgi:hypothetical protein